MIADKIVMGRKVEKNGIINAGIINIAENNITGIK